MTTDRSTLPQWKGHAVPWVARWTGEVCRHDPLQVAPTRDGLIVGYKGGLEEREPNGILWRREGLARNGDPEFAQVNTYRQRAAMRRRKCQICGRGITTKVISWLLSWPLLQETPDGETVTNSPPTCEDCIPLALELCPHLREQHVIAKVLEYRLWGVEGSIVVVEEGGRTRERRNAMIQYDRAYPFPLTAVIARKQIAVFDKFVLEEES